MPYLVHEVIGQADDLRRLLIQSEMAGVENVNVCAGNIIFVCLCTGYDKRRIIASPHYEHWRLMIAQPLLPNWIGLEVILIVVKEVDLNVRLARLIQKVIFIGPGVRIDSFRMRRSADVAIPSGFKREKVLSKCG